MSIDLVEGSIGDGFEVFFRLKDPRFGLELLLGKLIVGAEAADVTLIGAGSKVLIDVILLYCDLPVDFEEVEFLPEVLRVVKVGR